MRDSERTGELEALVRRAVDAGLPASRVAGQVEDSHDGNGSFLRDVEDAVREPTQGRAAHVLADDGEERGMALDGGQLGVDAEEEVVAKALPSRFVPLAGFDEVRFGLGPDEEATGHGSRLMRRLTSSQGEPAEGSRW